jgi:prephenate dehydrogenase
MPTTVGAVGAVDFVGLVGLGNMGSVLAANLVASGLDVLTHDLAGPDRSPDGAVFLDSLAEIAARAAVVLLSLPDGHASDAVARALVEAPDRRVAHVIDTSTVGLEAAEAIDAFLAGERWHPPARRRRPDPDADRRAAPRRPPEQPQLLPVRRRRSLER